MQEIQETRIQSPKKKKKKKESNPLVGKIPWRRKWQPTPVFLLGQILGQRSLEHQEPLSTHIETTEVFIHCKEVAPTKDVNNKGSYGSGGELWELSILFIQFGLQI